MKVKLIETGTIYDVLDDYQAGYIIEKEERGYKYTGHVFSDFEVIDDSPIEYKKAKKFLVKKTEYYPHTKFIDEVYISGEIEIEENTITVYKNVVAFYSPAKHTMVVLDIRKSERSENKHIWVFSKMADDSITLSPSIRLTQHEFSEHFFIERNRVVNWCRDSWETVYIKKRGRK